MNPVTADSFDSLSRQLEIWYALFMNLYPRIIMRVICGAQGLLRQDQSHTPRLVCHAIQISIHTVQYKFEIAFPPGSLHKRKTVV